MAPLSTLDPKCCAKWKKVSEENQRSPIWVNAHILHHNFLRKRGVPFTADRLAALAECSLAEAQAVLDEAVSLEWFRRQEPVRARAAQGGELMGSPARPAYYISPVKPK
jgi:hypothetical protein